MNEYIESIFLMDKAENREEEERGEYPDRLGVEFVSFREQIDTDGPLGRAIVVIIGAIAHTRLFTQ